MYDHRVDSVFVVVSNQSFRILGRLIVMYGVTYLYSVFFFFQAEDGIRDYKVTGVQTCALPIWRCPFGSVGVEQQTPAVLGRLGERARELIEGAVVELRRHVDQAGHTAESLPSRWSLSPVAPRCVTLRAPIRVPSRSASSRFAPARSDATTAAPNTSPQPVASPSRTGVPSAGSSAVRTGRPVK